MTDRTGELVLDYQKMCGIQKGSDSPSVTNLTEELDATAKRLLQYDAIIAKSRAIFEQRNRHYGDAISETGVLGAVVGMVGDYGRLKVLVLRNPQHGRDCTEDIRDKCIDMLNYLVIAQLMLEEENFDGR